MSLRLPHLLLLCVLSTAAPTERLAQPGTVVHHAAGPDRANIAGLRSMPGADIGAKANAAFAAMPASGGTVHVPPGSYEFATTIRMTHAGQHLSCDPGAVLHYTGKGDVLLIDPEGNKGGLALTIDGEGGCLLLGNPQAANGIHLLASGVTAVLGMRIEDFSHGNGIALSGANSIQILRNALLRNQHGIDLVTVPHFAPNGVHVSYNEIADSDWGVYSHNGHVVASRALGNVYRDNVFEGNRLGDIFLGWDAHTVVDGNYFESNGVGIAAGTDWDNVYDIQIAHNNFTTGAYRSEVELGYGFGFSIAENYEEGPAHVGSRSGCAVNAVPGRYGGTTGVTLRNPFLRFSEGAISTHEFCFRGSPTIPAGVLATTHIDGGIKIDGETQITGPLQLGTAQIRASEQPVRAGEHCAPEGTLLISTPKSQPALLYFCTAGRWQTVAFPKQ
jgi:hypothetical protein